MRGRPLGAFTLSAPRPRASGCTQKARAACGTVVDRPSAEDGVSACRGLGGPASTFLELDALPLPNGLVNWPKRRRIGVLVLRERAEALEASPARSSTLLAMTASDSGARGRVRARPMPRRRSHSVDAGEPLLRLEDRQGIEACGAGTGAVESRLLVEVLQRLHAEAGRRRTAQGTGRACRAG